MALILRDDPGATAGIELPASLIALGADISQLDERDHFGLEECR
jgi:hypothetical protein